MIFLYVMDVVIHKNKPSLKTVYLPATSKMTRAICLVTSYTRI